MTQEEEEACWREAGAWWARAEELADWAAQTLVNRTDVYGGQRVNSSGEIKRTTWKDGLNRERLCRHFTAEGTYDVIGLHATRLDETCRWVAVDIDAHDGQNASQEANLRFALEVRLRASRADLAVRLCDTSGNRGGYHLWMPFDRSIPMAEARRLVLWLARDWATLGVRKKPDLFPGNDHLTGKWCGNWLRLVGKHHKRDSWATIWSPRRETWRRGDEAIDALLTLRGKPVDVAAIVPTDFEELKSKRSTRARASKTTVAPGASVAVAPGASVAVAPGSSVAVVPGSSVAVAPNANIVATPPADSKPRGVAPSSPKRHGRAGFGPRDLGLARAALEFYTNDDLHYDLWLETGMALRNLADEAAAFQLWDDWSATSIKYHQDVTEAKWESIRPADESGGIGLGTLYHRAMQSGWSGTAFLTLRSGHGRRRATHRSGRRGTIVIPCKAKADVDRSADRSPGPRNPGEPDPGSDRPSDQPPG